MNWEVCFADMCRACMKIDGVLLHMYDDDKIKGKNLPDKLAELTSIQIDRSDGLPTMLCAKCAYRTDAFYEFKQQVQETEQKLRKMLNTYTQQDEVKAVKKRGRIKKKKPVTEIYNESLTEPVADESLNTVDILCDTINIAKDEVEAIQAEVDCIRSDENVEQILGYDSQECDDLPVEAQFYEDRNVPAVKEVFVKPFVLNDNLSNNGEETQEVEKVSADITLETPEQQTTNKIEDNKRCSVEIIESKDNKTIRVEKQLWLPLFIQGVEVEGELSEEEEEEKESFVVSNLNQHSALTVQETMSELSIELDNNIFGSLSDNVMRIKEIGIKNGKMQYQCTLCQMNYDKLTGVLLHTVDNHVPSTGPFFCVVCEKDCESQAQLRAHVQSHTGQFPYTCFLCNKAYSMKRYLKRHMVCHTDFPRYRCPKCGIRFKVKTELEDHITTHISGAPYECSQCSRIFNHKSNYKRHLISHHLDPNGKHLPKYPCEICGKRFLNNRTLITHMRVHTGEKPYKCNICSKSFSQQGNLINHGKIHTNPRSYTCEVCGKRFNQRATLRDHSLLHTGEKPYVCSICGMAFTFSAALRRHAWHHADGKPYTCDTCGAAFVGKYDLKRHMKIHNDRPRARRRRSQSKHIEMIEEEEEDLEVSEMADNQNETILIEQVLLNDDTMQIISHDETEKENVTALFSIIQCG